MSAAGNSAGKSSRADRDRWRHLRHQILRDISPHLRTTTEQPSARVIDLVLQPWEPLSENSSFFVFRGTRSRHVLKLFKDAAGVHRIAKDWAPEMEWSERFVEHSLTSAQLAWRELRRDTGLVWLDFGGTQFSSVHLGGEEFELDGAPFILQRRAVVIRLRLDAFIEQGDFLLAKRVMDDVIALMQKLWIKGISDQDGHILDNFGYVDGDRLIMLDVGNYGTGAEAIRREIERRRVYRHPSMIRFGKRCPALLDYLTMRIDETMRMVQLSLDQSS